jgi:uncharacterized protein (TIGR02594 family)
MKPIWIEYAEKHIGLTEIKGPTSAPQIKKWLSSLRAWWTDDETPWCGVFVAACLSYSWLKYPKAYYRAKAYLEWGTRIDTPVYGCVVIFERAGGGHVGFVVGIDEKNRLMVLGGNQGNKVSVAPFDKSRVAGYRWPSEQGYTLTPPPLIASAEKSSNNES